jgi:hypothetical protein
VLGVAGVKCMMILLLLVMKGVSLGIGGSGM